MRNKIPCSADRLGLLDPPMIQAVSEAAAFRIGRQYLSERRIRIVEANDAQISSTVVGKSGVYEQTIRLRDGHLLSKCSCSLHEVPMCRHCIAVLLEYHRWGHTRPSRNKTELKPKHRPESVHSSDEKTAMMPSAFPDLKLSEVLQFLGWLQLAMRAIEHGDHLPDSPMVGSGEVLTWIHTIRSLEEHRRKGFDKQVSTLVSEMKERDS